MVQKSGFLLNCIFYDILQKGRGSKDQNQILGKIVNLDKVLGG